MKNHKNQFLKQIYKTFFKKEKETKRKNIILYKRKTIIIYIINNK
jgi:hypothetical protein